PRRPGPVHPHARGDDVSHWRCSVAKSGTPPRAWGRLPPPPPPMGLRYTATRVGTTLRPRNAKPRFTVHPHARGDDAANIINHRTPAGTPPRAWGRPVGHDDFLSPARYTPTRVGTTMNASIT